MTMNESSTPNTWGNFFGRHRFGGLLIVMLGLIIGKSILLRYDITSRWFNSAISMIVFASVISLCYERRERLYSLLFGVPTILLIEGGRLTTDRSGDWVHFVGQVCGILFLFGAATLIVKSLFRERTLTYDSLFGAVCGYLFLGLGWSVVYAIVEGFQPGSFQFNGAVAPGEASASKSPDILVYYSFITLTTVGYGDIAPASSTTRTLAWIEAISGQFYLAVIVAALVSILSMNMGSNASKNDQG